MKVDLWYAATRFGVAGVNSSLRSWVPTESKMTARDENVDVMARWVGRAKGY